MIIRVKGEEIMDFLVESLSDIFGVNELAKGLVKGYPVFIKRHKAEVTRSPTRDVVIVTPWGKKPFELTLQEIEKIFGCVKEAGEGCLCCLCRLRDDYRNSELWGAG